MPASISRETSRQERRVEPLCAREPSGEFGQLACSLLALQCPLSTWSGAHVLRGSSGPLVKPYVGFSPVRLTDDSNSRCACTTVFVIRHVRFSDAWVVDVPGRKTHQARSRPEGGQGTYGVGQFGRRARRLCVGYDVSYWMMGLSNLVP